MNIIFNYLSEIKITSKEATFVICLLILIFAGIILFYISTFSMIEGVVEPRSVVPLEFEEESALRTT